MPSLANKITIILKSQLTRLLTVSVILFSLSGCGINKFINSSSLETSTKLEDLEKVAIGIDLQKISINEKNFLILTIDPKLYKLAIVQNGDNQKNSLSIQQIHHEKNSLATFNGGFFSEKFLPTGLLINDGQELYPLVKAKLLNGVFWIDQNQVPHLSEYSYFKQNQKNLSPELAIQNGPILLNEDGKVSLSSDSSNKRSSRTAIGINHDNKIVVIFLKQTLLDSENSLSLNDFAKIIQTSPELQKLQIHSLLNLDGGTSSGLAIGSQYFPELEKVQNVLITKPRSL